MPVMFLLCVVVVVRVLQKMSVREWKQNNWNPHVLLFILWDVENRFLYVDNQHTGCSLPSIEITFTRRFTMTIQFLFVSSLFYFLLFPNRMILYTKSTEKIWFVPVSVWFVFSSLPFFAPTITCLFITLSFNYIAILPLNKEQRMQLICLLQHFAKE